MSTSSWPRKIQGGKWLAVFLLATQAAFAFPSAPPASSGRPAPGSAVLVPAALLRAVPVLQAGSPAAEGTVASTLKAAAIQTAIAGVRSPDLQTLASALGLNPALVGRRAFDNGMIGMEAVSRLSGEAVPALAVKWRPAGGDSAGKASGEVAPALYLLSWDGNGWQASYLTAATGALTLQVLVAPKDAASFFAVIIYRGVTAVPYPVIFRFQDHHASLVWDGRSDSTSYAGYDYGSIQFEKTASGGVPVMIATGRADPGLLVFPITDQKSGRGFQAATLYVWKNDGYAPLRTEYSHDRDYMLYRFIAALHLHDFRTAYSLIDPQRFLKTNKPSLKLFRTRILKKWPEFTDDRIFEVPAAAGREPADHRFILRLGGGKVNVYHPSFTAGPTYRLTGLQRNRTRE